MGFFGGFGMILFWGGFIWFLIWLLWQNKNSPEDSMEILKKRYALGEITKKQYEEMRKNILRYK